MDAILATVAPEAMRAFGAFSLLLLGMSAVIWHLRGELRDARKKLDEVQETRIREAQELIRVTERSTETQIARTQGDQTFAQLMQLLISMTKGAHDTSAGNRQLLEQLVDMTPQQRPPAIRGGP